MPSKWPLSPGPTSLCFLFPYLSGGAGGGWTASSSGLDDSFPPWDQEQEFHKEGVVVEGCSGGLEASGSKTASEAASRSKTR